MCLELMFNAIVMAALAFSRFTLPSTLAEPGLAVTREAARMALSGHAFGIFVIAIGAAEAGLGLALVIALYRSRETVEVTNADLLKH